MADPTEVVEPCPVEDASFCDFVRVIETFVIQGDIDSLLDRADLKDCYKEGGAYPGFERERDCPPDEHCLYWGIIQGEGGCAPLRSIKDSWGRIALEPRTITGLVFSGIPNIGLRDPLDGPAVIIDTGSDEFNLVLFFNKYEGIWKIAAILLQRISAAQYQTPPELIIPWP